MLVLLLSLILLLLLVYVHIVTGRVFIDLLADMGPIHNVHILGWNWTEDSNIDYWPTGLGWGAEWGWVEWRVAWTGLDGWTVMNGILEFAFHNTVIQYLNTETYYKWQNPIRIDGSDQPPRLWYVLPPEAEPKDQQTHTEKLIIWTMMRGMMMMLMMMIDHNGGCSVWGRTKVVGRIKIGNPDISTTKTN